MRTILLSLVMFAGMAVMAQGKKEQNDTLIFKEMKHDFGTLALGNPVSYDFVFVNEGNKPAIVYSVNTSCQCTSPYYPKSAVAPGASEKITLKFDAGRSGSFHKSATVNTSMGTYTLVITGTVPEKTN